MQNFRSRRRNSSSDGAFKSRGQSNFNPHIRNFRPSRPSRRPRGENIDVSKFIQRIAPNNNLTQFKPKHSFADFGFCRELQKNLDYRNYSAPTPVQDESIAPLMAGRDLIGLANTGTGKTAAFLLPLIEKVLASRQQKVLIIAPTRELAIQIDNEFRKFSNGLGLYSVVCVGGTPMGRQIQNLRRSFSFVIGTPGRLKDISDRGLIRFDSFQSIVLDEVDRMLDMDLSRRLQTF